MLQIKFELGECCKYTSIHTPYYSVVDNVNHSMMGTYHTVN